MWGVGVWCQTGLGICLFGNAGLFVWFSVVAQLPGSAVMVNPWQMLHGDRFPAGVVVLISRGRLKYRY